LGRAKARHTIGLSMSVFLVTQCSPDIEWTPWIRTRCNSGEDSKPGSGNIVQWLVEYFRGPISSVKLYFKSVNKFLLINLRTNVAKLIYLDLCVDETIQFYRLEFITPELECQILQRLSDITWLNSQVFSAKSMMNSAAPFNNPDLFIKFFRVLFPRVRDSVGASVDTGTEFCTSLVLGVICSVLPPDHPLCSVDRYRVTPHDLLALLRLYFDIRPCEAVYSKLVVNLGLESIF
jgi:hypothetical protein